MDPKDMSMEPSYESLQPETARLMKTLLITTNRSICAPRTLRDASGVMIPISPPSGVSDPHKEGEAHRRRHPRHPPMQPDIHRIPSVVHVPKEIRDFFGPDYRKDRICQSWFGDLQAHKLGPQRRVEYPVPRASSAASSDLALSEVMEDHSDRIGELRADFRKNIETAARSERRRRRKKQLLAYGEFLSNERTYVRGLKTFLRYYVEPMRKIVDPKIYLEVRHAFTCLLQINEPFLEKIERCFAVPSGRPPKGLELLFVKHAPVFRLYIQYIVYYAKAVRLFNRMQDHDVAFGAFVKKVDASLKAKGARSSTIRSFLIKPIQKLPQYGLLWTNAVKQTHPSDPRRKRMEMAQQAIKAVSKYVNRRKKALSNSLAVERLVDRFRELRRVETIVPTRRLIIFEMKGVKVDEHPDGEVYVFTDLFLLVRRGKLVRFDAFDADVRCYAARGTGHEGEPMVFTLENATHRCEVEILLAQAGRRLFADIAKVSRKKCRQAELKHMPCLASRLLKPPLGGSDTDFDHEAMIRPIEREVFSGWLKEKGGFKKTKGFRRRFHIITSDFKMKYYDHPPGSEEARQHHGHNEMEGSYSLIGSSFGYEELKRSAHSSVTFFIRTIKGDEFVLLADDAKEVEDWFSVLAIMGSTKEEQ